MRTKDCSLIAKQRQLHPQKKWGGMPKKEGFDSLEAPPRVHRATPGSPRTREGHDSLLGPRANPGRRDQGAPACSPEQAGPRHILTARVGRRALLPRLQQQGRRGSPGRCKRERGSKHKAQVLQGRPPLPRASDRSLSPAHPCSAPRAPPGPATSLLPAPRPPPCCPKLPELRAQDTEPPRARTGSGSGCVSGFLPGGRVRPRAEVPGSGMKGMKGRHAGKPGRRACRQAGGRHPREVDVGLARHGGGWRGGQGAEKVFARGLGGFWVPRSTPSPGLCFGPGWAGEGPFPRRPRETRMTPDPARPGCCNCWGMLLLMLDALDGSSCAKGPSHAWLSG